jgi:hypothetical protein
MRTILAGPAIAFSLIWVASPHLSRGDDQKPGVPDVLPAIPLTISPAAEPVPALKYRLLPSISEQTHGNGAIDYERALVNPNFRPFDEKKLNSWLDLPADGLPRKDVEAAIMPYASLFSALEQASRRETCDWQLPIARDGFNTHVEHFQGFRLAAKALALKARLQIAQGDLEGALSTMRTIFKTSLDCNQGRLLITSLIACAAASTNTDTLQALVQHPQAPNLYWALTDLPSPLIDCRPAIDVEAMAIEYEFPQLAVFRSRRLSADEARHQSDELLARWLRDIKAMGDGNSRKTLESAREKFASAARAANDKQILLDSGWSKADVAAMAPEQAAWLIIHYHWRVYRDELFKWACVPGPQRIAGARRSQERLKESLSTAGNSLADFELTQFMPATEALYAAVDRRDRPIALFRVVEALRMYAAAHQGALPASLDQIDQVPIPFDPMTGQPFRYRRAEDGTASLETPPLDRNNQFFGRHYVIRVRK